MTKWLRILTFLFLFVVCDVQGMICKVNLQIIDAKTKATLSGIKVSYRYLYQFENYYRDIQTDSNGICKIYCRPNSKLEILVNEQAYHWYSKSVEVDAEFYSLTIELVDINLIEPVKVMTDPALEEYAHLSYGVNSILPINSGKYKFGFQLEEIFSKKYKIGNRAQMGYEFPFQFAYYSLENQKDNNGNLMRNPRFLYFSTGLSIFQRTIFNLRKKNGSYGLFLDLGLTYQLPIRFRLNYRNENDELIIIKGIHNYKDFNSYIRIGYSRVAIKCMRRFNPVVRAPYWALPVWQLGVEVQMPLML